MVLFSRELHGEARSEKADVVAGELTEGVEVSGGHLSQLWELRHDEPCIVVEHGATQHLPSLLLQLPSAKCVLHPVHGGLPDY